MSQVVRPERTSQKVARSLLELAAALADEDMALLNVPTVPSEGADGHAHGIGVGSSHGPERLTLTVEEAARSLGVSRAHAYELAARGEIPTLRLGRRILVPKEALVRMMRR
jgi:excisionase family DNA binding protein